MAKEKTYDVFISYRRQGGAEKAELVKGELIKRGFRESRMFMDTRSLTYIRDPLPEQRGRVEQDFTPDGT